MNPSDDKYLTRARIGVGASVGSVIGALAAHFTDGSSTAVLIGTFIGAVIGGLIGSRIRSQAFQYIWFEYSPKVGIKIFVSGTLFTGLMMAYFYSVKFSDSTGLHIALLAGTMLSMIFVARALNAAISELDDMLRNVLKEAVVFGFLMSICILFFLGLVNFIYPIPSDWVLAWLVTMFSFLIGRLYTGWKYR